MLLLGGRFPSSMQTHHKPPSSSQLTAASCSTVNAFTWSVDRMGQLRNTFDLVAICLLKFQILVRKKDHRHKLSLFSHQLQVIHSNQDQMTDEYLNNYVVNLLDRFGIECLQLKVSLSCIKNHHPIYFTDQNYYEYSVNDREDQIIVACFLIRRANFVQYSAFKSFRCYHSSDVHAIHIGHQKYTQDLPARITEFIAWLAAQKLCKESQTLQFHRKQIESIDQNRTNF